jgi:hypothetical protein
VAIEENAPIPEPLLQYFRLSRFGMPRDGGWLDQDAGYVERVEIASYAYNTAREYKGLKAGTRADWIDKNPDKWKFINDLDESWDDVDDG